MSRIMSTALVLLLLAAVAQAQDTPQADVAAEFSGLYIIKGYTIWMGGGSASAAFNINDWLGVAGDFGGYVGHVPESFTGETYMAGPRFSYRKSATFVPFAQALFGGSHFSQSTGGITGGGNEFAFNLGGGADFVLRRNHRFALRPQFEYVGIRSSGSTTPAVRLSIGLVYRIGKK